jgi:hypothetical protein
LANVPAPPVTVAEDDHEEEVVLPDVPAHAEDALDDVAFDALFLGVPLNHVAAQQRGAGHAPGIARRTAGPVPK